MPTAMITGRLACVFEQCGLGKIAPVMVGAASVAAVASGHAGGRCEQPENACPGNSFGAALRAELGEDVAHVRAHRVQRHRQLAGDLPGRQVVGRYRSTRISL
jgi:hypothetical protein